MWFSTEKACSKALAQSDYLPYPVQLYKSFCLRACEPVTQTCNKSTISISGYPKDYTEKQLAELLGEDSIKKMIFTKLKSEVTFKNPQWAKKMMIIDGVPIGGNKLVVRPLGDSEAPKKVESIGLTNLYVKDLQKEVLSDNVRRAFARYGKI